MPLATFYELSSTSWFHGHEKKRAGEGEGQKGKGWGRDKNLILKCPAFFSSSQPSWLKKGKMDEFDMEKFNVTGEAYPFQTPFALLYFKTRSEVYGCTQPSRMPLQLTSFFTVTWPSKMKHSSWWAGINIPNCREATG